MSDPASAEFHVLRETIRSRGSLRLGLCVAGFAGWALILIAVLVWLPNPVASAIPLLMLAVVFEVNRLLSLGVERIGRYLQVFYEEAAAGGDDTPLSAPAWERAAMRFGPAVPGAGGHPLLLPLFAMATVVNLLAVMLPGPIPLELAALGVPHLAFVVWMIYCDRAMRKQRAQDLARFREMRG